MKKSLKFKLIKLGYSVNCKSTHFYKYYGKWIISIDINTDFNVVQKFSIFMSIFDNLNCQRDIYDLQDAYNILKTDLSMLGVVIDDN